jgi:hypothetical protein
MRYGFRIASFGLIAVFIGFLVGRQSAEADGPATQPSSLNSQPTEKREQDARLMDRAYTDPLIVIEHNAAVAERQYVGFFGDNKPQDVYMRGNLRLARSYFGKQDVFCVHPWSQDVPAYADFSQITLQASGTIVFNVHNLFDPKTKQAGHCMATFKVNDEAVRSMTVDGNVWRTVEVPFDHNHVGVEISAIGWWWEHAFFTYEVELNAGHVQASAEHRPVTSKTPADGPPSQSQDSVAEIRQIKANLDAKVTDIEYQLEDARDQLAKATPDSDAQRAAQSHIDALAFEKMSAKADAERQIAALHPVEQTSLSSAAPTIPPVQGELTYDLNKPGPVTKFPNWHGPWKTCPLCGGTGHSYSSQQMTEQDASPDIAAVAGTGMSATIKNAISYCEMCGGTGQVPDYGK